MADTEEQDFHKLAIRVETKLDHSSQIIDQKMNNFAEALSRLSADIVPRVDSQDARLLSLENRVVRLEERDETTKDSLKKLDKKIDRFEESLRLEIDKFEKNLREETKELKADISSLRQQQNRNTMTIGAVTSVGVVLSGLAGWLIPLLFGQ